MSHTRMAEIQVSRSLEFNELANHSVSAWHYHVESFSIVWDFFEDLDRSAKTLELVSGFNVVVDWSVFSCDRLQLRDVVITCQTPTPQKKHLERKKYRVCKCHLKNNVIYFSFLNELLPIACLQALHCELSRAHLKFHPSIRFPGFSGSKLSKVALTSLSPDVLSS